MKQKPCVCWRPYQVECTRSLSTSEVKRLRARSVLGWGTAWEDLRVLSAFPLFLASWFRKKNIVLKNKLACRDLPFDFWPSVLLKFWLCLKFFEALGHTRIYLNLYEAEKKMAKPNTRDIPGFPHLHPPCSQQQPLGLRPTSKTLLVGGICSWQAWAQWFMRLKNQTQTQRCKKKHSCVCCLFFFVFDVFAVA